MFGGDEVGALVLDLGSEFSKAGYAGEDTPKAVFHSSIGTLYTDEAAGAGAAAAAVPMDVDGGAPASSAAAAAGGSRKQSFVGRAALYRRDHMSVRSPLRHGLVQDWDGVEQLCAYAFDQHLRVSAREHPLLLSEPTFQPSGDRERMLQLMFERFDTPATFLCKSSVLTAFSAGRSTACVVESGAGHTTVSPVHDGYVVHKGVKRSHMGGQKLDEVMERVCTEGQQREITPQYLLSKKVDAEGRLQVTPLSFPHTHPSFHRLMLHELYRDVKESVCRLGESAFDDSQKFPPVAYELPDGHTLEVGNERFSVPEHMFNPNTAEGKYTPLLDLKHDFDGFAFRGMQHMVLSCVESVDVDLRKDLYGNVVLSGGNTLFPGLPNRLTKEVGGILSAAHKVKVVGGSSLNDRRFGVWIGGSILASLGTFHQMWISKAEYEEQGAAIISAKCP